MIHPNDDTDRPWDDDEPLEEFEPLDDSDLEIDDKPDPQEGDFWIDDDDDGEAWG